MTFANIVALFLAMVVVALIPGPGVFAVVARSMASGFSQGLVTVMGIVCGDYIFIILSLYGLSAVAQSMGELFLIVKYLGAAYLCWLGLKLLFQKPAAVEINSINNSSSISNFLAGLLTTLGNPKAILFYVSFFPAFFNVSDVSAVDVGIIMLTATISFGGVMAAYAYAASRASYLFKSTKANRVLNVTAGSVMLGSGTYLAIKA